MGGFLSKALLAMCLLCWIGEGTKRAEIIEDFRNFCNNHVDDDISDDGQCEKFNEFKVDRTYMYSTSDNTMTSNHLMELLESAIQLVGIQKKLSNNNFLEQEKLEQHTKREVIAVCVEVKNAMSTYDFLPSAIHRYNEAKHISEFLEKRMEAFGGFVEKHFDALVSLRNFVDGMFMDAHMIRSLCQIKEDRQKSRKKIGHRKSSEIVEDRESFIESLREQLVNAFMRSKSDKTDAGKITNYDVVSFLGNLKPLMPKILKVVCEFPLSLDDDKAPIYISAQINDWMNEQLASHVIDRDEVREFMLLMENIAQYFSTAYDAQCATDEYDTMDKRYELGFNVQDDLLDDCLDRRDRAIRDHKAIIFDLKRQHFLVFVPQH